MNKHIQRFWFAKDALLDLPYGILKYIANAQNKYLNAKNTLIAKIYLDTEKAGTA